MAGMTVSVAMTVDDFQEFMEWKKDKAHYADKLDSYASQVKLLAKKATWALGEDPKRPGKAKIIDHDHAAELLEMANDFLA